MASCKDCIHRELCNVHGYIDADECGVFKNKADVVEVVRCRNCMHCEIVIDQFDNDWYFCKKTIDNAEVKPDDFCSYGERRAT